MDWHLTGAGWEKAMWRRTQWAHEHVVYVYVHDDMRHAFKIKHFQQISTIVEVSLFFCYPNERKKKTTAHCTEKKEHIEFVAPVFVISSIHALQTLATHTRIGEYLSYLHAVSSEQNTSIAILTALSIYFSHASWRSLFSLQFHRYFILFTDK